MNNKGYREKNSRFAYPDNYQDFEHFAVIKNIIKKILILSLISPVNLFGQETILSEGIINIAEELAYSETDPGAVSGYIEKLHELADDPVKINSSGMDEISRMFFLSDFQVKSLADYAHSSGPIISVYELLNIPGFDKETVNMMIPFIRLDNGLYIKSDSARWRNTLITNISLKTGNVDTASPGSPIKVLTKYNFKAGSISGGITTEKDPGEKFLTGNPPLPDFISAHFAYSGHGVLQKLILGDYSARFGQGTSINTGIRTALSLTSPGYMSTRNEIKPYTSINENNFFRGIAAEFSLKNLGLTIFYSENQSDATLGSSSGYSEDFFSDFYKAGIHNSKSSLQKKDAISETNVGTNISYNFEKLRIGLVWLETKFSLPLISGNNDPENNFDFQGEKNNLYSIYYNSFFRKILFYGEFSINEINKYAFVQGFTFRPSDRLTINTLYRNYYPGYISFHGNGPGNNAANKNENGILTNFTFETAKHLFISTGCDIYFFPWLKYRCSAPTQGIRQEVRIKYLPNDKLVVEASYNNKVSMADKSETTGIPEINQCVAKTFKASVRYSFSEYVTFTTKINYKTVDQSGSRGMLLLQDLNYRFRNIPVTIWTRVCIFNTDDWDSRLYTYENDLLFSFNIPALSGKGLRSYTMLKCDIGELAELRVKYGWLSFIKSGDSQNNSSDIKLQFRIRF